ncbi:arylsulfatase B-like isoform X2, partial [Leptotrombidium deliense]
LSEWFPPYNVSNDFKPQFETEAEAALRSLGRNPKFDHFHKLRVQCGKRPKNASSNCKPNIEPCLFNLHVDPCEYNNVAKMYPKIVRKLWQKIILLNQTSVKPANTETDKCADPNLHENSWTYWTPKSC